MTGGDALLRALPPVTFVVGKGGVGKTTCAAAVAVHAGVPTLLVSTDPARALASVLRHPLRGEFSGVPGAPRVQARMLDAAALRAAFMERWRDVIATIVDRGTYLDDADIAPLVDTALPGSDEIFAALELARIIRNLEQGQRLVVDTAPTGHTLRLLDLPATFRALVALLDSMQDKHRFVVRTLTHTYRRDAADAFLAEMRELADGLDATLRDATRCAALLVADPEPVVLAETRRYRGALRDRGIHVPAVVWNGVDAGGPPLEVDAHFVVPRLPDSPVGREGLERWWDALAGPVDPGTAGAQATAAGPAPGNASGSGPGFATDWLPRLTIVAGKGGVGKTTVACALALLTAERLRTLLVSTDPAPSVADALGEPVGDEDTEIAAIPRLVARQMDATAAFDRLRQEYAGRVDSLFEALVGRGINMDRDRAIARELLALAPPGVDEVYALTLLSHALFSGRLERVVVDPAPTGHLLRLLEMPQLALEWTHQLMRLLLRYKDVAGLGETARELLEFARDLRRLDALLRDPSQCGLVLVTLDEPVVREESERLARAVAERGVAVLAVVHNRSAAHALPVGGAAVQVVAPDVAHPLVGAAAIRRWTSDWARLPRAPDTSPPPAPAG